MLKVDKNICIGSETCTGICPNVFEMGEDGKSKIKKDAPKNIPCIEEAIKACPVQAISK